MSGISIIAQIFTSLRPPGDVHSLSASQKVPELRHIFPYIPHDCLLIGTYGILWQLCMCVYRYRSTERQTYAKFNQK